MIVALNASPVESIQRQTGGAHGVLVTAVHPAAFGQAIGVTRRQALEHDVEDRGGKRGLQRAR